MFKLKQSQTYFWPVVAKSCADGGTYERHPFDIEFRRMPQSEVEELRDLSRAAATSDRELVRRIVVGWRGIADESGETLPFSQTKLDELLDMPGVAAMIVIAWLDSLGGLLEKN